MGGRCRTELCEGGGGGGVDCGGGGGGEFGFCNPCARAELR